MKTRPPSDPNQLTKAQLVALLATQEKELHTQNKRITSLNKQLFELAEQLRLQRHQQYGASSEKTDPNQQPELFDEVEDTLMTSTEHENQNAHGLDDGPSTDTNDIESEESTIIKKARGRKPLPSNLERRRIEHDVADHDKTCPCGCQKTRIGEDISEKLNVIPAQIVRAAL